MPASEQALVGWKEIADYLRVPVGTIEKRRKELLDSGVLMYRLVRTKGNPKVKKVWTFPSLLQKWCIMRGKL